MAKQCLYDEVIVPTALYGADALGMRSAAKRKVNVLKMKSLKSLVGWSRIDRVRIFLEKKVWRKKIFLREGGK